MSRDLLPISIEQRDPLEQLGTNAQSFWVSSSTRERSLCRPFREVHLIGSHNILEQLVSQNPVGVLLDVGAQMLDMQSTEVVSTWLRRMELDISRRILERYYHMGAC